MTPKLNIFPRLISVEGLSFELLKSHELEAQSYYLLAENNKISLISKAGKLSLDLLKKFNKLKGQLRKSDPLYKAILIKGKLPKNIVEIGTGTASDSCYFLSLGLVLKTYERNPYVYVLASNAFEDLRAEVDISCESCLGVHSPEDLDGQVVFYDPMYFTSKKGKAKSRKEMEAFKEVVGADLDEVDILRSMLKSKAKRIVVKRPIKAKKIIEEKFCHSFMGNSVRYDLYIP